MFGGWSDFYLLIGSAAAALVGLLFVVATLTTSRNPEEPPVGVGVYLSPTVFHFAVVLVLSAVGLAPGVAPVAVGAMVAASALAGLVYAGMVSFSIRFHINIDPPHWSDFWFYGVLPALAYLGLAGAAFAIIRAWPFGPEAMAAVLVGLLLVTIRNAWDLVTWLAPRKNAAE